MLRFREFLNESLGGMKGIPPTLYRKLRTYFPAINTDSKLEKIATQKAVDAVRNKDIPQSTYILNLGNKKGQPFVIHKNGTFVVAIKDGPRRVFFDETKHGEEYKLNEFVELIKPDSKLFLVKGGDDGTVYRKHREREKAKIAISAAKENRVPLNYLLLLTKELQRGMVLGVFGKHRLDSYSVAIGPILGGYYDIYYPVEDKYESLWKEAMLLRNDLRKELSDKYGFASSKGVRHETVSRVVKYYKNLRKELGIK